MNLLAQSEEVECAILSSNSMHISLTSSAGCAEQKSTNSKRGGQGRGGGQQTPAPSAVVKKYSAEWLMSALVQAKEVLCADAYLLWMFLYAAKNASTAYGMPVLVLRRAYVVSLVVLTCAYVIPVLVMACAYVILLLVLTCAYGAAESEGGAAEREPCPGQSTEHGEHLHFQYNSSSTTSGVCI